MVNRGPSEAEVIVESLLDTPSESSWSSAEEANEDPDVEEQK
jgi:hypothetical protein